MDFEAALTFNYIKTVVPDPCYQAWWITAHGAKGGITLADDPIKTFHGPNMSNQSENAFGCREQPFIREFTLLGCNTYDAAWANRFVCAKVNTFDHILVPGNLGRLLGRNPYWWEKDEHVVLPPHDLSRH